jgi:hypothetical protein
MLFKKVVQKISKKSCKVDELLEECWRIGESRGHDQVFNKSIAGPKCCCAQISLRNFDHVVNIAVIQLSKILSI